MSKFGSFIPIIQENQISVIKWSKKFSGAFGVVSVCKINYLEACCVKKKRSEDRWLHLRAEGLVMQQFSGHGCFLYLYGFTEAGALIIDHICSKNPILVTC